MIRAPLTSGQQRLGVGVGGVVDEDHLVADAGRAIADRAAGSDRVRSAPEYTGITIETSGWSNSGSTIGILRCRAAPSGAASTRARHA